MSARPRVVAIVLLVVIAVAAVFLLARGASEDGKRFVRSQAVAFNLRHPESMRELQPASGEWLHLQRKGLDEFIVEPLKLPAYKGDVGGLLPVEATRELERLKSRFPDLEPVEEGKPRITRAAGSSLVSRASRKPRLYGRLVLLPQPTPGAS